MDTNRSFSGTMSTPPSPDSPYGVISTGGFFLMFLLLMLPVIGLIAYIIIAVNGRNQNRRNFCRATLILMIINVIISAVMSIMFYFAAIAFVGTVDDALKSQGTSLDEILKNTNLKSDSNDSMLLKLLDRQGKDE